MKNIYKFYFSLPNFNKPIKLVKAINRIYLVFFKFFFQDKFLKKINIDKKGGKQVLNTQKRNFKIAVSLTSFPQRIDQIHYTIETIFNQSVKADSITLYLSKDEFKDKTVPETLLAQQNRGLSICFVDDNLKSHKKYFYAFSKQKDNLVITFDDDSFYPYDTIEKLVDGHFKYSNAIICNRGHKISIDNKKIRPYSLWIHNFKSKRASFDVMPTGVGGVLYPPESVHPDIFDVVCFKEKCFYADDIWLKIHSLRNNTKVVALKTFSRDLINVGQSQKVKLVTENVNFGGNDNQLNNLLSHYNLTFNNFKDGV